MEMQMLVDTWNLIKAYVPAKDKAIVATRFVDIAMDNGVLDEDIQEMIGHDDELDEAIRYSLDLEEGDEEELYER